MAKQPTAATSTITDQDFEQVENLLHELKERANDAHQQEKTILLGMYAKLVKIVSPEVQRLKARIEREQLADFNRKHKSLRQADRDAQAGSNGNA